MNILLLNWRDPKNPRAGGAEYVTMKHASAWVAAGNEVTWLASSFKGSKKREILNGVHIVRKGSGFSFFFYTPYFYMTSKKRYELVIDEIHGIPFFTPLYVKEPILAFIHEVAGEIWDYAYPFPFNLLGRIVERVSFIFYRSTTFWTDAQSTINELITVGIKRSLCIAIPCPIDNQSLTVPSKKESVPTFLFIGRLVPMKGVEAAIEAFSIICREFPLAKLWVVGHGDKRYVNRLHESVKKLQLEDSIQFFGFVSQEKKLSLMRHAHLLLHPSVKEGWGLVVLEAASQATPSIGYNVSGLRDTIVDGKTGILVAPKQPEAIADAAIRLLKDTSVYTNMQQNCLHFSSSFSWKESQKKSLALIQAVLKNSPVTAI